MKSTEAITRYIVIGVLLPGTHNVPDEWRGQPDGIDVALIEVWTVASQPSFHEGKGHGRSIWWLRGYRNLVMKEFRREISAVRPNNRVKLRMDVESLEDFNVLQGFENGSLELIARINVSFSPVAES